MILESEKYYHEYLIMVATEYMRLSQAGIKDKTCIDEACLVIARNIAALKYSKRLAITYFPVNFESHYKIEIIRLKRALKKYFLDKKDFYLELAQVEAVKT